MERLCKEEGPVHLKCHPRIRLEGLRKTIKTSVRRVGALANTRNGHPRVYDRNTAASANLLGRNEGEIKIHKERNWNLNS
jgi:hypothetical protein